MSRQVFPQAPSPTMTSLRRISAMVVATDWGEGLERRRGCVRWSWSWRSTSEMGLQRARWLKYGGRPGQGRAKLLAGRETDGALGPLRGCVSVWRRRHCGLCTSLGCNYSIINTPGGRHSDRQ